LEAGETPILPFRPSCPEIIFGDQSNKNEKSPPDLSVRQGQIGGWEFAMLSFPRWLFGARLYGAAASFPTLFSTASGVFGLVAGPSSVLRALNFE
jgi:hypothetical protein